MKKRVGIFFGPAGGATERVAKKVQAAFGEDIADVLPIKECKATDIDKYTNIVFGCSTIGKETWQSDKSKPDWDIFRPEIEKIEYKGKNFALFGLGDSVTYAAMFVDAMGILAKEMIKYNANIVGRVPTCEYNFKESDAVIGNEFIGLPIDEDYEQELTDRRVKEWVDRLKLAFD
ncbi:MAG TPA: flavodoxin [Tenuifilaceae bacterium]|nr:flavodoxin [Tenuifilaceae bacterium]HPE17723.1 flavodoxin [Tenuifilaceae bacterium]HPJ45170.1 flavodoxin [Tenuifilaceae bacterium]HPQ33399.1 flavodoxin [Tenuifilaceae bacterium]HRX66961.1 flavodoxin [Tenuifilaceae bacterium]